MHGFLGSQVLGAGVVSAVHDSADGAGQGDPELGSAPAAPPRPLLDILAVETSEKATTFNLEGQF